jgi:hypothetical protein
MGANSVVFRSIVGMVLPENGNSDLMSCQFFRMSGEILLDHIGQKGFQALRFLEGRARDDPLHHLPPWVSVRRISRSCALSLVRDPIAACQLHVYVTRMSLDRFARSIYLQWADSLPH